jgi:cell wall-associated NlpC family hydrolase
MNIESALDYIKSFYLVPYKWGGDDFTGIDCSGLALEYLKAVGITLPASDMTAQSLHDFLLISSYKSVIGPGALAFYGKSDKEISHVTILDSTTHCIGANGGNSNCLTLDDAKKYNAFVKLRPIEYRQDLVSILMPRYA